MVSNLVLSSYKLLHMIYQKTGYRDVSKLGIPQNRIPKTAQNLLALGLKIISYHCLRTINLITVSLYPLTFPVLWIQVFSRSSVTLRNSAAGSLFWDGHALTQSQRKNETGCPHRSAACGCELFTLLLCPSAWTIKRRICEGSACAAAKGCHIWKRSWKKVVQASYDGMHSNKPSKSLSETRQPSENFLQPSLIGIWWWQDPGRDKAQEGHRCRLDRPRHHSLASQYLLSILHQQH